MLETYSLPQSYPLDPTIYIDDRWLYDIEDDIPDVQETDLSAVGPCSLRHGSDITIVSSGFSTNLALQASDILLQQGVHASVIDVRVINPFQPLEIIRSVSKTGRLLVLDGGTRTAGFAAEVISSVTENLPPSSLTSPPRRLTLPDSPAPTSTVLENSYYFGLADVLSICKTILS